MPSLWLPAHYTADIGQCNSENEADVGHVQVVQDVLVVAPLSGNLWIDRQQGLLQEGLQVYARAFHGKRGEHAKDEIERKRERSRSRDCDV